MNRLIKLNLKSACAYAFVVFAFLSPTLAAAGENTLHPQIAEKEWKTVLNQGVLSQNGINEAKVLVKFTVDEANKIKIVSTESPEEVVKQHVLGALNGMQNTSNLRQDEVYQVLITFKRI
ncbi:MAG: hypothetical protein WEC59_12555 [Salibacteraceae bacterium]